MIKGLNANGRHTFVTGGSPGPNYFNNFSGQSMVGQLRLNPSTQNIEVYDGTTWVQIQTSYATVGLSPHAEDAIDWAIKKRAEEHELDELCKQHPALNEAYERLQIIKALVKQDTENKKD